MKRLISLFLIVFAFSAYGQNHGSNLNKVKTFVDLDSDRSNLASATRIDSAFFQNLVRAMENRGYSDQDFTTFAGALDTARQDTATLIVSKRWTLSGDTDITGPMRLSFTNNGRLYNPTGSLLTISAKTHIPYDVQVFEGNIDSVRFDSSAVDKIYFEWFGGIPDDATDDDAAIQAAIRSTPADGTPILGSPGDWYVGNTITFGDEGHKPYNFGGSGVAANLGTMFVWTGHDDSTMFRLNGVRNSYFHDFGIELSSDSLETGIESRTKSGQNSTHNVWERIWFQGSTARIDTCFQFVAGSGGDGQNSENTFRDCVFNNYRIAAVSIEHAQSKIHKFESCDFYGATVAREGITGRFTQNQGPSIKVYGCLFVGHTVADIFLGSPVDEVFISGTHSEGSAAFVVSAGPGSDEWPVTIIGCEFYQDGNLASDQFAINLLTNGPLTLIGNKFGDDESDYLKMRVSSNGPGALVAMGNHIKTSADPDSIFYINSSGSNGMITLMSNTYEAVAGTEVILPNHFILPVIQPGRPRAGSQWFQGNNTTPDTLWIHNGTQWLDVPITF